MAEEECDPTRDAPVDFGLSSRSGHEMAAGTALEERDAVHMNLLARQREWLGQLDGVRRDAALQEGAATVRAGRGFRASCHGDRTPRVGRLRALTRAVASDAAATDRDGTAASLPPAS